MGNRLAIILAAGKGTRMESDLPKVLVPACDRPLVEYVIDAVEEAGIHQTIVVVGYRADLVREALGHRQNVAFVDQTEQLGTGHAVQVCRENIAKWDGAVLVVTGDSPMIQPSSLTQLLDLYDAERPACVIGTLIKDDPSGLGRVVRDSEGNFEAIVEQKDATEAQQKIKEVSMSTYVFDAANLVPTLDRLQNDNQQGEFYITDGPGILKGDGKDVRALPVLKPCEALSINNLAELRAVEQEMRRLAAS